MLDTRFFIGICRIVVKFLHSRLSRVFLKLFDILHKLETRLDVMVGIYFKYHYIFKLFLKKEAFFTNTLFPEVTHNSRKNSRCIN